ncbi:hypothetical protein ES703_43384 [subsurface metagenome]
MGEVGDARLDLATLGDVLVGRDPAAIGERLVDDLDRTAVRRVDHHRIAFADIVQHAVDILVDVAGERPGFLAVGDHLAEAAAGPDDVGGQAVHLDIALVADHQALRGVEQKQALRHVVDGGVEALLFQGQAALRLPVLLRQLAHHHQEQGGDGEHRGAGDGHQHRDLLAPVGQRRRRGCAGDDHHRKVDEAA